ncbi:unnamed protein product [Boreogadus saida]
MSGQAQGSRRLSAVPKISPNSTPTGSPKMSPSKEAKPPKMQTLEGEKKPEQPQQAKASPSVQAKVDKAPPEPPKAAASQAAPKAGQSTCPLCKVGLNMGSKDPPNYNTCTDCKNTVCNQCGFNPQPNVAEKEWLCLNCQMHRALGASEPPGTPFMKPPPSPSKLPAASDTQSKDIPKPHKPQEKETALHGEQNKKEASTTISTPGKQSTPALQQPISVVDKEVNIESKKNRALTQNKLVGSMPDNSASAKQQDSGGLFGFGGPKTNADAAKPTESVTGKMFGFGSSIFNSASTLITTPPVSPKLSAAKDTKTPAVQKAEQEKKPEQPQQAKASPSVQAKVDKAPSEPPKAAASQAAPKAGQSTCPLCKVGLNMGSKDPPNYNTCTDCKNTVCNQCGFNLMPSKTEVKEWLCLNCQMQRALGASEAPGQLAVKPQASPKKVSPSPEPQRKVISESGQESQKQLSPAPGQKTPQESRRTSSPQKPPDQTNQTGRKQSTQQESGGFFGFGGSKAQPDAAKPADSVTGKMFGFGSQIFSSASTLITTPPPSPKMAAAKDTKPPAVQKAEQEKKPEQPQQAPPSPSVQAKVDKAPSEPPKAAASQAAPKAGQSTCPLCKVGLNMGSKDPPNFNTCTDCKNSVCNQCGFNPMPTKTEDKEWLCLTCQMQRALGASEAPGQLSVKPQASPKKVSPSPEPQKTIISESAGSPQRKQSMPAADLTKDDIAKGQDGQKQSSPSPGQRTPQDSRKTSGPQKPPGQTNQTGRKQSTQQESGGFFGFGGSKPQPDAAKPEESVTGKMFGFGSSIFNSASTLITTPPVSPKMSAAKDTKPPAVQKAEQEKKPEQPQPAKASPSVQAKVDKAPSEPPKEAASQAAPKAGQSTCPLCKVGLNMGSKDPPNYNTCTDCKNTVCNQCGFNPQPNSTGVKEWLCLTCQMQRALRASEAPGQPSVKAQASLKKVSLSPEPKKKVISESAGSPQRKQSMPAANPNKTEVANGQDSQKHLSKAPVQATPDESQRTSGPQKPVDQTNQTGRKQSTQQESGGFFGFGGSKAQPDAAKPEESVTGKMFGFGSSIFNSASTLITTPPVSPKMAAAKDTKTPAVQKAEQEKKPKQPQPAKASPSVQAKVDKAPSEPPKAAGSQATPKAGQSTCPLCKVGLNMGSKDPPNFNTCTDCKNTVCNQCGFTSMPNETGMKEWLCLTCQMQRALRASEAPGQPLVIPQASPKKVSPSPEPQKKVISESAGSPQRKQSMPAASENKDEVAKGQDGPKPSSPSPGQKTPQERRKLSGPQKPPDQTNQTGRKQSTQQESGGFFGFGGSKAQPDAAKPEESVTGKMFGFGSSIFNSASTLITTPPVSPKMAAAKDTKPPAVQKAEQEKKPEQPQQAKASPSVQAKVDKAPPEPPKAAASQASPKAGQSTCPLCKVGLNMGSSDPPNFNTCTDCKNSVCNQCGFNPQPNSTGVKEWLCLTCQMQRALQASEAPAQPLVKPQASLKNVSQSPVPQKKVISESVGSPQRTQLIPAAKGQDGQKQLSPSLGQKTPQDSRKMSGPQKSPDLTNQTGRKQSTQQESGGFFGFGGSKAQPDAPKPAESVTGKMFGFGSSIFNSASTLITTPPVSPKMSAAKGTKQPAVQKVEQEKKPEQPEQAKASPSVQAKVDEAPSEPPKAAASQAAPKAGQSTCPLCKVGLNMGSKDPPNFNTCTDCKNIVCNQCGFNPNPTVDKVREWLCLTCHRDIPSWFIQSKGGTRTCSIPHQGDLKSCSIPRQGHNKYCSATSKGDINIWSTSGHRNIKSSSTQGHRDSQSFSTTGQGDTKS